VVVNDIFGVVDGSGDGFDGGCAGVVPGDMAGNGGSGGSIPTVLGVVWVVASVEGLVTRVVEAGVSLQACEAASQVLGGSVDVPASFSRRGGSSLGSVCVTVSAVGLLAI
jgi:hypothetical protein